jgi:ATP-dependent Clp protease ATP-binding subunit ClpA
MYAFQRFTERAKHSLALAQEEAERSGHSYIGTEHLLLGLLKDERGLAHNVLSNLGMELPKVRETIEQTLNQDEESAPGQPIVPTSRVKKVIEISFDEAKRMGHNYVGTEHLLLGLMVEGEGIGAHVLEDLGLTLDRVRAEINRLLAGVSSQPWTSQARSRMSQAGAWGELPVGPDAADLLRLASALAAARGAAALGLEHLRRAMDDPAVTSLLQLAAGIRQAPAGEEERRLRDEYARSEAAWRASIEKPPTES